MYNDCIRYPKGGGAVYLYMMGWHWKHPADMKIERPNGHFGLQVILIQSKARVRMGGTEYQVEPNTFFLVKSCLPHCLYADGEEYVDDWIRFSPEQEDHAFLDSADLEWNVPIRLSDSTVSDLIAACCQVNESNLSNKAKILHHLMMSILLYITEYTHPNTAQKRSIYDDKLDKLRRDIYSSPGRDWSIPKIAEELCISVSHFQRLYKTRYGISCTNDVFMSRMEYAKQLLLETELSANEISDMCGYQSYEYFSKSFSRYACVSPMKYRAKFKEN